MDDLINMVNKFRDERNWRQFHNEKDLAISISIEAAELLELFQWENADAVVKNKKERLEEELADILIYALMLADNLDFDVSDLIQKKIRKNAIKYPVEKSIGKSDKYTSL